ncbi:hypothetical protein [Burkholderia ambifaria]|uniref:hypothetical protein n=1 Tax=Burkholderia ambifaria TaxID=152480 RepID=UPI001B9F61B0|nr:hypothetical protein [Burkholderia ambifaria]MBR8257616.1 hypothetical protein [Burkholderia ambifaria]
MSKLDELGRVAPWRRGVVEKRPPLGRRHQLEQRTRLTNVIGIVVVEAPEIRIDRLAASRRLS